jgi:putative spermidine/putrescine transport system permease protein
MKKLWNRPISFYPLAIFFGLFILFLYGPLIAVFVLSLQGPEGTLVFPVRSFGFHWIGALFGEQRVGNFGASFQRSFLLGLLVLGVTTISSLLAGMSLRDRYTGSKFLFYLTITSLIVPGVLISLGIGLVFQLLGLETNWYSSGLAAHLTWTIPFAFLIIVGIFNRFNPSYEEAARDLGASDWVTFKEIILPLVAPALIGVAMFSFTLSYDEFVRTSLVSGAKNTLPLEIFGMTTNVTTPAIYALGTVTTTVSLAVLAIALLAFRFWLQRPKA